MGNGKSFAAFGLLLLFFFFPSVSVSPLLISLDAQQAYPLMVFKMHVEHTHIYIIHKCMKSNRNSIILIRVVTKLKFTIFKSVVPVACRINNVQKC